MSYFERGKGDKCISDIPGHTGYPCDDLLKETNKKTNIYCGNKENGEETFIDICIDSMKMSFLVCFTDTFDYIKLFHCCYFLKRRNSLHDFICYSFNKYN